MERGFKRTAEEWAGGMGLSASPMCVWLVHLADLEFEVLASSVLPIV